MLTSKRISNFTAAVAVLGIVAYLSPELATANNTTCSGTRVIISDATEAGIRVSLAQQTNFTKVEDTPYKVAYASIIDPMGCNPVGTFYITYGKDTGTLELTLQCKQSGCDFDVMQVPKFPNTRYCITATSCSNNQASFQYKIIKQDASC